MGSHGTRTNPGEDADPKGHRAIGRSEPHDDAPLGARRDVRRIFDHDLARPALVPRVPRDPDEALPDHGIAHREIERDGGTVAPDPDEPALEAPGAAGRNAEHELVPSDLQRGTWGRTAEAEVVVGRSGRRRGE